MAPTLGTFPISPARPCPAASFEAIFQRRGRECECEGDVGEDRGPREGGQREPSQRCPLVPGCRGVSLGLSTGSPLVSSGLCPLFSPEPRRLLFMSWAPRFPLIGPRLPLEFWASGMSHPDLRPLLGGPGLARPGEKRRHPLTVFWTCASLSHTCGVRAHTRAHHAFPHACTHMTVHTCSARAQTPVCAHSLHTCRRAHTHAHTHSPLCPAPLLMPLVAAVTVAGPVSAPRD